MSKVDRYYVSLEVHEIDFSLDSNIDVLYIRVSTAHPFSSALHRQGIDLNL